MAMRLASHDRRYPPQALARRPAGPRRVRCARAGARRGARLRPHARDDRQHLRDARGPAVPRQSRRGQRPRRRAAVRSARPDAARKDRRSRSAALGQRDRRTLARRNRCKGRGSRSTACSSSFENQELFARAAKLLLRDLNLIPDSELDETECADEDGGDDQEPEKGEDSDKTPEQGEGESEDSDAQEDQTPGDSEETGDTEGAEADMAESDDEAAEAGEDSPNPPPPGANAERGMNQFNYKVFTQKFDEIVKASELCPRRRARAAARPPRQAAREPRRRRRAARQQAAAAANGAAEPQLGVRPRRGPARHRAPDPRRHRPAAGAELQGRAATPISATRW